MDTSDAIKVRYQGYEILVEPELAKEAKLEAKDHDIQRLLFVQEVFEDAGEGKRASAEDLEEDFGTRQIMKAAEEIFEKGDMQLTTEQKKQMREEKHKQIVSMIARRAQDPKTGNPHPPQRVENALEEAGFNADAMKDVEEQFDEAIDAIRPIIPVSLDEKQVAIKIPNDKAGKAYDTIQQTAEVLEEQWGNEYFFAKIKVPAGVLTELMEKIQEITGGESEVTEA
ncbi:MAG: ribosome assembly factor SBDS [Candidatus Nanohalobium sp.]